MIVIEGHSDDVITVAGDLEEEFTYKDSGGGGDLVAFGDGTLLRIVFDPDGTGNWRITPVQRGTATLVIEQTTGEDGTDRATLTGPVRWVARGDQHHLVQGGGPALPPAWSDLLTALTLLARGQSNDISPFNCSHDQLAVMADPANFTPEEVARLATLGFDAGRRGSDSEGTFTSSRFGSA